MTINPKRDPLGSSNVFFYKPTTSKKIEGYTLIDFKMRKKVIVPKKPEGGLFGLPSTFGNIKKLVF